MLINNFKSLEELSKQDYLVYDDLAESIGRINNPLLHLPLKNNLDMICGAGSVTFTRSTTATYVDRYGVVQDAAVNEARFEKEGLLIEGASTNKCLQSEDFSTTWYQDRCTISTDVIEAPDGTITADGLIADTDTYHAVRQVGTPGTATIITGSVFAKKGNQGGVRLNLRFYDSTSTQIGDSYLDYNIDTGSYIASGGSNASVDRYIIKELANGWYRFSLTCTYTGSGTVASYGLHIYPKDSNGNDFVGDGSTVNTYLWGAQLKEMPFATSYIPTTTAAVTRAKDVCYVTYAENMPDYANEFSVLTDFDKLGEGIDYDKVFRLQNAPVYVQVNIGTDTLYVLNTGVVYQNSINFNQLYRIGLTYNKSISAFYIDGNLKGTSTPSPIASGTGEIYIGNGDSGIQQLFGHISNFRIYDIALTEKEMRIA